MDAIPILPKTARLWRDKADFFRPFRKATNDASADSTIRPLFDPDLAHGVVEEDGADLAELNNALSTLVDIFPDVEPEVLREMLTSVSEESRVAVVTEHILKRNVKGTAHRRLRKAAGDGPRRKSTHKEGQLPIEDTFRGDKYREAVRILLYQEFRNLSHSTIKGVMAENNCSYARTRPVLQILTSKTWRSSIVSLWTRKSTIGDLSNHPAVSWHGTSPSIKSTGSTQLDQELYVLLARPLMDKNKQQQIASDRVLASDLNEAEAIEAQATYDCECCYSAVAFEQIAACDSGEHMLCFDCISRTTTEALYGQGWARSADLEKSTIRCFAPALQECQASLPSHHLKRALEQHDNPEIYSEFCRRVTSEVLTKSRVALQRCPFCSYAEVDETPSARPRRSGELRQRFSKRLTPLLGPAPAFVVGSIMSGLFVLVLVCVTLLAAVLSSIMALALLVHPSTTQPLSIGPCTLHGPMAHAARSSLSRVYKSQQGLRFKCEDPTCRRVSCTRCLAEWRDPHICFDNEKTSLRTAIEASATAAIKRTCPKCLLSFVKASGCNKLVCNCGYTMCYICRSQITTKEGYSHFCQHFRPSGGRCTECDRCDLYGDEDEETAIRRAAVMAEREWREKESKSQLQDDDAARIMVEAVIGHGKQAPWHQRWLDAVLDTLVAFEDVKE